MENYDPGMLNDFGGGKIQWWQDYIRAEVGRCNEYWQNVLLRETTESRKIGECYYTRGILHRPLCALCKGDECKQLAPGMLVFVKRDYTKCQWYFPVDKLSVNIHKERDELVAALHPENHVEGACVNDAEYIALACNMFPKLVTLVCDQLEAIVAFGVTGGRNAEAAALLDEIQNSSEK